MPQPAEAGTRMLELTRIDKQSSLLALAFLRAVDPMIRLVEQLIDGANSATPIDSPTHRARLQSIYLTERQMMREMVRHAVIDAQFGSEIVLPGEQSFTANATELLTSRVNGHLSAQYVDALSKLSRADVSMRLSNGSAFERANIKLRLGLRKSPTTADVVNRQYDAQEFIYRTVRHALMTLHNDRVMHESLQSGTGVAVIRHKDPLHRYHGMVLEVSKYESEKLNYFHPNSDALLYLS